LQLLEGRAKITDVGSGEGTVDGILEGKKVVGSAIGVAEVGRVFGSDEGVINVGEVGSVEGLTKLMAEVGRNVGTRVGLQDFIGDVFIEGLELVVVVRVREGATVFVSDEGKLEGKIVVAVSIVIAVSGDGDNV
jgi:hypothetical protein